MSEYNIRGKDQFCFVGFWISVCVHVYHIVKWHTFLTVAVVQKVWKALS